MSGLGARPDVGRVVRRSRQAGLILVETQDISSSVATVDFVIGASDIYNVYQLIFSSVTVATDDIALWLRMGTGGTPTYQSGVADYAWKIETSTADNDEQDEKIQIMQNPVGGAGLGNAANEMASGMLLMHEPAAAVHTTINGHMQYDKASNNIQSVNFVGKYLSTTAVTALRIMASSGNILGGRFSLYGITDR
jgi:hypothetical protein